MTEEVAKKQQKHIKYILGVVGFAIFGFTGLAVYGIFKKLKARKQKELPPPTEG